MREYDEEFQLSLRTSNMVKEFATSLVKKSNFYELHEDQLRILRQDERFVSLIRKDEIEVKHCYEAFMKLA
jgi:hypothetical protein